MSVFTGDWDFQQIGFYFFFSSVLKLLLFASNHGAEKLNRAHWFDYPFFMCQRVSSSKLMFPNSVDINLQ